MCLDLFNTVASDVCVNTQRPRPLIVRTRGGYKKTNQKSFSAHRGEITGAGTHHSAQHVEKRMTPEGTEDEELCKCGGPPSRQKLLPQ